MRLTPSDPDVETLVGRIDSEELDLQPDFQRGEVWPILKKQRLIDSILRDWHVPPVHVIVDRGSHRSAVLDGQQRLAAIRDFKRNRFVVDGNIPPFNAEIKSLDGKTFDALPREWKARVNQFTIRVFRITDYEPSEPAELFFRLNQPTALTSAEKRNAFFGATREQVRDLVMLMESMSLERAFLGFSGARMAYDDMIARTCLTLENKSLRKKITANGLADRYRAGTPFSAAVIRDLTVTIEALGTARKELNENLAFNKATAQTCLIFACQLTRQLDGARRSAQHLLSFLPEFSRFEKLSWLGGGDHFKTLRTELSEQSVDTLLHVYTDRSTSRVADTSSVVLRDFVVWTAFYAYSKKCTESLPPLKELQRIESATPRMRSAHSAGDVENLVNEISWDLAV